MSKSKRRARALWNGPDAPLDFGDKRSYAEKAAFHAVKDPGLVHDLAVGTRPESLGAYSQLGSSQCRFRDQELPVLFLPIVNLIDMRDKACRAFARVAERKLAR